MKNKDLQRLLATFPDDLEVYEVGIRNLNPISDVSERRDRRQRGYLVLEAALIPPERPEGPVYRGETNNVHVRPRGAISEPPATS